jgi:hypothetical protein
MDEYAERELRAYNEGSEAGLQNEPDSIPYYEDAGLDAKWDEGFARGRRQREEWEAEQQQEYEAQQQR